MSYFNSGVVFQFRELKNCQLKLTISVLVSCNAVPEWRRVSNDDRCGQFGGGEIGF